MWEWRMLAIFSALGAGCHGDVMRHHPATLSARHSTAPMQHMTPRSSTALLQHRAPPLNSTPPLPPPPPPPPPQHWTVLKDEELPAGPMDCDPNVRYRIVPVDNYPGRQKEFQVSGGGSGNDVSERRREELEVSGRERGDDDCVCERLPGAAEGVRGEWGWG